jgi:hypothetical protein
VAFCIFDRLLRAERCSIAGNSFRDAIYPEAPARTKCIGGRFAIAAGVLDKLRGLNE